MQTLSDSEVESWCRAVGVSLIEWRTLCFTNATGGTFEFNIPATSGQMIALVIVMTAIDDELGIPSDSHLLWLRDWDIWGEEFEAIGRKTLSGLRSTFGEQRPLLGASGHLFGASERVDLQTFLVQPLFFEWDAYIVPSSGEYVLLLSHDGWIRIASRSAEVAQSMFVRYAHWNPRFVTPVAVSTTTGVTQPEERRGGSVPAVE